MKRLWKMKMSRGLTPKPNFFYTTSLRLWMIFISRELTKKLGWEETMMTSKRNLEQLLLNCQISKKKKKPLDTFINCRILNFLLKKTFKKNPLGLEKNCGTWWKSYVNMVNMLSKNVTRYLQIFIYTFILFHQFFTDSEKLEFSPFDLQYIILDNDNDPDDNFFNIRLFSDMSYFTVEQVKSELSGKDCNSFSIPNLKIRSLQKNFDKLINFLITLGFEFKLICISETWCSDQNSNNDLYKIPN